MSKNEKVYDCDTKICQTCTSNGPKSDQPCVGVIGANDQLQTQTKPPGQMYYQKFFTDKDSIFCNQDGKNHNDQTLGLYNGPGFCIPADPDEPNTGIMQADILKVDGKLMGSIETKDINTSKWPLETLHKTWGDQAALYSPNLPFTNYGVNSRNVYISRPENVRYWSPLDGQVKEHSQKVIVMEAHGDHYTGNIPGLTRVPMNNTCSKTNPCKKGLTCVKNKCKDEKGGKSQVLPVCPEYTQDAPGVSIEDGKPVIDTQKQGGQRVGGVACTKENYGPGVYNALVYCPKTEDTAKNGRGYVFAMWTFHYEEHYGGAKAAQTGGTPNQWMNQTHVPCVNESDVNCHDKAHYKDPPCQSPPPCPAMNKTDTEKNGDPDDNFTVVNHEIDIEIPANSPQMDWDKELTLDTMNCNTWWNDINNYDIDTGAFYSQVAVKKDPTKAKKGLASDTYFSAAAESDNDKDYHWFTIDWRLKDPDDPNSESYVCFYYDDPFDPTLRATDPSGAKLPQSPSGKPEFCTKRFVPTRGGRLNIGPWMGWWGYGRTTGTGNGGQNYDASPAFDRAKVRMAHLTISPQLGKDNKTPVGVNMPQSYDQPGARCDFKPMFSQGSSPSGPDTPPGPPGPGPPSPPGPPLPPGPSPSSSHGLTWLWILLGVLAAVILLAIAIYYYKKHHKKNSLRS